MKVDLTPEARGVLQALVELRSIRHLDRATSELAKAGLAEVHRHEVRITARGAEIARTLRRAKRHSPKWADRTKRRETR